MDNQGPYRSANPKTPPPRKPGVERWVLTGRKGVPDALYLFATIPTAILAIGLDMAFVMGKLNTPEANRTLHIFGAMVLLALSLSHYAKEDDPSPPFPEKAGWGLGVQKSDGVSGWYVALGVSMGNFVMGSIAYVAGQPAPMLRSFALAGVLFLVTLFSCLEFRRYTPDTDRPHAHP